jgi:hypothetical protein
MQGIPEALPLPLGGGREGLAERKERNSEASVERSVMLSDREASVNQRKRVEPSPYRLPILADASPPLGRTPFLFFA